MTTKVRPIPEGYEGATPYLCVQNAAAAIEFYIDVRASCRGLLRNPETPTAARYTGAHDGAGGGPGHVA